jgi:hypothetical protein
MFCQVGGTVNVVRGGHRVGGGDRECGQETTWLYDKQDDLNFFIVNFPYLCSNIPASPVYGVYILQHIRYARACSKYDQFWVRGSLFTNKVMSQGFQLSRLKAAFWKFYGRCNDLILPIQSFFGPHAVWYVSYQSLSCSWHSDLDYGAFSLSKIKIGLTAGATGQQGMLTPPTSDIFIGPCTPILWFIFSVGLMRLITVRFFVISGKKKGLCLDVVESGRDRVVVKHGWCRCCAEYPERTHVKFRGLVSLRKGGCSRQCRGNLYCLPSGIVLLMMP